MHMAYSLLPLRLCLSAQQTIELRPCIGYTERGGPRVGAEAWKCRGRAIHVSRICCPGVSGTLAQAVVSSASGGTSAAESVWHIMHWEPEALGVP